MKGKKDMLFQYPARDEGEEGDAVPIPRKGQMGRRRCCSNTPQGMKGKKEMLFQCPARDEGKKEMLFQYPARDEGEEGDVVPIPRNGRRGRRRCCSNTPQGTKGK